MEIHVRLYGVLREKLDPEEHGRAVLQVPEGTTINDILARYDLSGHFHVSVNEDVIEDWQMPLHDSDQVDVFRPSAGGSGKDRDER